MRSSLSTSTSWSSSTHPGGKIHFLAWFDLLCSGHCKKLAPEYAAAATILGAQNPPLYLAKVDTTENNALGERFEVKGFPTLLWFV